MDKDSDMLFIVIGALIGLGLGLIVFLVYKDFLIQTCEFALVESDQPRSIVCKLKAVPINKELTPRASALN